MIWTIINEHWRFDYGLKMCCFDGIRSKLLASSSASRYTQGENFISSSLWTNLNLWGMIEQNLDLNKVELGSCGLRHGMFDRFVYKTRKILHKITKCMKSQNAYLHKVIEDINSLERKWIKSPESCVKSDQIESISLDTIWFMINDESTNK